MPATLAKAALGTVFAIGDQTTATGGIDTATVGVGGSGYAVGNIITVVQAGASGGTFKVTSVTAGAVTGIVRQAVGTGYSVANGLATTVSPAGGTGATINITKILWLIAELHTIGGPSQKVATVDVTNMDSPSSYAEHIASVIDGGQIALGGNWINATYQVQLKTDMDARTIRSFQIVLPGAMGTWTASGYVADLSPESKHSTQLTFSVTIKITGSVTFV